MKEWWVKLRCLFCKKISNNSRSLEHIVPESLGNLTHTLSPGIVCDNCNNYFSRKVEKPFLELPAINLLRFHQEVPSKKGKIPPVDGIVNLKHSAIVTKHLKEPFLGSIDISPTAFNEIIKRQKGTIVFPIELPLPDGPVISRFLAKVALEVMAQRVIESTEGIEYLVDDKQLNPIRNHARWGEQQHWPVSVRRIYHTDQRWKDLDGKSIQLVHEFDILHMESNEWYFILAIFGLEFAINYGGPEIDGYLKWLDNHNHKSPLYYGKNAKTDGLLPLD